MNAGRPGPPYVAPRGQRWVPTYAEEIDPVEVVTGGRGLGGDRKCQQHSGNPYKHNPCNAAAVAITGNFFLCGYHLGQRGMWVDAGIVMRWALEPIDEKE